MRRLEGTLVDRFIVASIQQKLRVPLTLEEYQGQLQRFLRAAAVKRARLVVFPESVSYTHLTLPTSDLV